MIIFKSMAIGLAAASVLCLSEPASAQVAGARAGVEAAAYAQTGDQIRVTAWPQSAFGPPVTATVDFAGNIVVPPAGIIQASRIPIGKLRDTLMVRISKYIRDPEVDVQVLRRVTVNGAVFRPDVYYMDLSATLRDAIARAGGITEAGTRRKVSIVRNGVTSAVPGWETDTSAASVLLSGDQVVVGRRSWIELNIIPVASLGLATASFLLSLRK
jgi:polysaccharide export outer membrane protein